MSLEEKVPAASQNASEEDQVPGALEKPSEDEAPADETEDDSEPEATEPESGEEAGESDSDELSVTIGDDPSSPSQTETASPEWLRRVRKDNARILRENRELREKLAASEPQPQIPAVGDEPTLEGCGWDEAEFKKSYNAWHERKRAADAARDAQNQAAQRQQQEYRQKVESYNAAKAKLGAKDYEEAEEAFLATFSQLQQGVIVSCCANPEQVVYALGKYPAKAAELAAIQDPAKFIFAVAKLEDKVKMAPKKAPPAPIKNPSGAGGVAAGASKLKALEIEADRTGDRRKLIEYKRQQKGK